MRNAQVLHLFIGLLILACSLPAADAGFLNRQPKEEDASDKVRTYQPPPEHAMEEYCEPIRAKIYTLSTLPLWKKPFVIPQRNLLIRDHHRCTANLMMQEHEYLKHTDIQKGPSLPKLRLEETTGANPAPAAPVSEGTPNAVGP